MARRWPTSCAIACSVAALLCSGPASAADGAPHTDARRAAAQALFESARELMQRERFAEACPKLKKSIELEDAPGTRLNLAWCHEQRGQTASAWVNYQDALALAVQREDGERQALARERLAALAPKLSRIRVALQGPRPAGAWLRVDGVTLGGESFDTSFAIDPGEHRLSAGAPGFRDQWATITVSPSEPLQHVELAPLRRSPPVTTPAPASAERARTLLTGSSLGVGVAGLVGTGVFGWQAMRAWDERNRACRVSCDTAAVAAGERAHDLAWAANVSLGIGLLGAGVGAYLLWSTPTKQPLAVGVATNRGAPLLVAAGSL